LPKPDTTLWPENVPVSRPEPVSDAAAVGPVLVPDGPFKGRELAKCPGWFIRWLWQKENLEGGLQKDFSDALLKEIIHRTRLPSVPEAKITSLWLRTDDIQLTADFIEAGFKAMLGLNWGESRAEAVLALTSCAESLLTQLAELERRSK